MIIIFLTPIWLAPLFVSVGIGSIDGTSLVVQYQAEINQLQDMLDATMGRVEEIERWDTNYTYFMVMGVVQHILYITLCVRVSSLFDIWYLIFDIQ